MDFLLGYFAGLFTVAAVWVGILHAKGLMADVRAYQKALRAARRKG